MKSCTLWVCSLVLLTTHLTAAAPQTDPQQACRLALNNDPNALSSNEACQALVGQGEKGDAAAYQQLGALLLAQKQTSVGKRGLYYLSLAADNGNVDALDAIYQYLSERMSQGKVPLKWAYLLSYLEQHWQQQGKPQEHLFNEYQQWLALLEKSHSDPQHLPAKTIEALAIDFENGYFVGKNMKKASQLYQLAADQGRPFAQFKTAQLLYPHSPKKALPLLEQAANNHSADAMMMLGDHFGCHGQKSLAQTWYQRAAAAGHDYAQEELEALQQTGKPSQCD